MDGRRDEGTDEEGVSSRLTVWTHFSVPPSSVRRSIPPLSLSLSLSLSLFLSDCSAVLLVAVAAVDTWATPQGSSDPFILAFDGEYCFSKPIPAAERAKSGVGRTTTDGELQCSTEYVAVAAAAAALAVTAAVFRTFRRSTPTQRRRVRRGDHKISPTNERRR